MGKDKSSKKKSAVAEMTVAVPDLENGTATAAATEVTAAKPKKAKKKAKAAQLELAAVAAPAADVPDPAKPAQAVAVAMPAEAVEELAEAVQDANGGPIQIVSHSKSPGGGRAFQRVKAEEWIGKQGAINNSYQATFGEEGWGAKAQQVLGQVRGKDFRHEKTKKKRGTYKGGQIDSKVNSFKYDSD
ncbi:hypothetical protein WJX74_001316 [Apatococcus lobatus]|uniref:Srp40 C-terminal domain-containing protein n=1 Tax=Apatococcus lobatus TaxID=904363 RepID=A0AAW1S2X6_9CHLO